MAKLTSQKNRQKFGGIAFQTDLKESDEDVWVGVAEEDDGEEGAEAAVQNGRAHVDQRFAEPIVSCSYKQSLRFIFGTLKEKAEGSSINDVTWELSCKFSLWGGGINYFVTT